jgi:hypothetical protein
MVWKPRSGMAGSNRRRYGTLRDCSKVTKARPHLARASQGLPLEIWGRLRRGITSEINAAWTIIFIFSLVAIVLWYRLRTRGEI